MMNKREKTMAWIAFFLMMALLVTGCGNNAAPPTASGNSGSNSGSNPQKLKVALILPGPINDNGWDSVAYEGLQNAKKDLGVDVAYRESVAPSDFESAFRAYAQQGYNVIIGHGNQFNDAAKAVAKDFPNTKFIVTSSNISQAPNLASINVLSYQVGYLGGIVAAYATKSKKVAFIGGQEIPPIIDGGNGFAEGVKSVDPSIQVLKANTGSFDDVAKAKETAKAFIQQGADVVLGDANQAGLGVINAAKDAGVLAIGYGGDQSNVAPQTVIASGLQIYANAIPAIIKVVLDGKFQPKFYPMGVKQGAVGLALNPALESKLPAGAIAKINQVIADMKSGKNTVGVPK